MLIRGSLLLPEQLTAEERYHSADNDFCCVVVLALRVKDTNAELSYQMYQRTSCTRALMEKAVVGLSMELEPSTP